MFCQERAKKVEGEALSAGLGKGRLGGAAPGRSRGGCRMDDVDLGCLSD